MRQLEAPTPQLAQPAAPDGRPAPDAATDAATDAEADEAYASRPAEPNKSPGLA